MGSKRRYSLGSWGGDSTILPGDCPSLAVVVEFEILSHLLGLPGGARSSDGHQGLQNVPLTPDSWLDLGSSFFFLVVQMPSVPWVPVSHDVVQGDTAEYDVLLGLMVLGQTLPP